MLKKLKERVGIKKAEKGSREDDILGVWESLHEGTKVICLCIIIFTWAGDKEKVCTEIFLVL